MGTRKKAVAAVEADVDRARTWFASLWAPLAHLFEGRQIWLLAVPVGIWFWMDRALIKTWLSLVLGVVLLVAVALLIRKVIMPRVDIQAAADKAQEDPIGAALVFLGGVLFMIAVIAAAVIFVGGMRA